MDKFQAFFCIFTSRIAVYMVVEFPLCLCLSYKEHENLVSERVECRLIYLLTQSSGAKTWLLLFFLYSCLSI
jgi:hypothetical protein